MDDDDDDHVVVVVLYAMSVLSQKDTWSDHMSFHAAGVSPFRTLGIERKQPQTATLFWNNRNGIPPQSISLCPREVMSFCLFKPCPFS